MITATPDQPVRPAIQTREQFEAVLENIVLMRREREELWQQQEQEIAAVREKHRAALNDMERCLDQETCWAETWARAHPEVFGADQSLLCGPATVGFRTDRPWIDRASRRWNWTRIAATLADLPWGKRYLRLPPPEVDKEAIVADLATLSLVDLRAAGLKVFQGDRFYITPHAELALQEAA